VHYVAFFHSFEQGDVLPRRCFWVISLTSVLFVLVDENAKHIVAVDCRPSNALEDVFL